jgi:hypothetical protein
VVATLSITRFEYENFKIWRHPIVVPYNKKSIVKLQHISTPLDRTTREKHSMHKTWLKVGRSHLEYKL